MTPADAYQSLYTVALGVLGVVLFLSLIRSIRGPRIADRIVAVNMIGSVTICIVCTLALKLAEGYLADVALIYAMLSFLAVVVLSKIYLGVYLEKKHRSREANKDA